MTEKTDEVIHRFFCNICGIEVVLSNLEEVEDFRIGTKLYCLDCYKRITTDVINQIIKDTSIPKTFRRMFGRYLKWVSDLEENGGE